MNAPANIPAPVACVFTPVDEFTIEVSTYNGRKPGTSPIKSRYLDLRTSTKHLKAEISQFILSHEGEMSVTWHAAWDVDLKGTRSHCGRAMKIIEECPGFERMGQIRKLPCPRGIIKQQANAELLRGVSREELQARTQARV